MLDNLNASHVAELDALVTHVASSAKHKGELQQLARLFSDEFRAGLHKVLSKALRPSAGKYWEELDVQIGWIDKMPLADIGIGHRVELGDAVIFGFDWFYNSRTDKLRCEESRAVILQAKVTEDDDLTSLQVPVDQNVRPGTSSHNELVLLQNWPKLQRYAASRSKNEACRRY